MQCESCGHENIQGARFCASCGVQLPSDSPHDGWIGQIVGGRYRVMRVLGEGGMGVVYAAEQQMGSTVRKVAIKTLHHHLSRDPSILARFNRECGTVSELEHPNTIKVYDFGKTDDGTLYIAMEFVEGRSLDRVITDEGSLEPDRVVRILSQVAGALDEAHGKGIVHRDLKPENVILGQRLGNPDFVKVLDFGIAARRESGDAAKEKKLTQQGMVLGTPPYMSPEQFTGQELDKRSDVYSLGVMAYEMLTGRLPFHASTPWQWATEHMTAQPFPMEQTPNGHGVPKEMAHVVLRSLAKRPEARYDSAGEFVSDLERSLEAPGTALSAARTEAMQAAPTARLSVSEPSPPREALTATEHAISATQDMVIPVERRRGGLVAGLLVLAAAGGAAAFFASKPTPEVSSGSGGGSGLAIAEPAAAGGTLTTTPQNSDGAPQAVAPGEPSAPSVPFPSTPPVPASSKPTSPVKDPAPSATKPSETKPVETKPPETKPVETKPVETGPTCDSCRSLVESGKWSQASAAYGKCDAKGKSACTAVASRAASTQLKAASGDCGKMRAIVSGAKGVGVSAKRMDDAVAKCK